MITLEKYKEYLLNYFRYEIDNTIEKRKEREIFLKKQFSDKELTKIISDTYSFAKDILKSETVRYGYYAEELDNDNSFGIHLFITGGGDADNIFCDSKNRLISEYIMSKIFGEMFQIEVRCEEIERECEDDVISFDYHYYLYIQGFPKNREEIKQELNEISTGNKALFGTGSYENVKSGNTVSITGDGGNAWKYFGPAYTKLAPKYYLWEYYDKNPDNLSEEELIDWYIREYYNLRLKDTNPHELLMTLNIRFGDKIILLCHESPGLELNKEHFCHRRLLADWIELETGIIIPEVSIDESGNIKNEPVYDLKPKIIKLIK